MHMVVNSEAAVHMYVSICTCLYTFIHHYRSMIVNLRCGEVGPAKFEFVGETEEDQYVSVLLQLMHIAT